MMMDDDEDDLRPFAAASCLEHERDDDTLGFARPSVSQSGQRNASARLLPDRPLPAYAYLPGRFPHPVRDPRGHSFGSAGAETADPDAFAWGMDLFNQGYYWEAHEAWEALWRIARRGTADHDLLQGLILLAATGVKLREGKSTAARRHGFRAASFLRRAAEASPGDLDPRLGLSPACLAAHAEAAVALGGVDHTLVTFEFELGRQQAS